MSRQFEEKRQEILETCVQCGECAKICPAVQIAGIDAIKPKEIQARLYDFVNTPVQDEIVAKRIDSCLECFKCVDSCPKGLNPLLFVEIAKTLSFLNGIEPYASTTPENYSSHYHSLNTSLSVPERRSILTPSEAKGRRYLFFPGCNIYNDSQRVLKARAILDRISDDIAFLPGLKFCCGDRYLYDGHFDSAQDAYEGFSAEIRRYNPDTVILWCPTCLARMKKQWLRLETF